MLATTSLQAGLSLPNFMYFNYYGGPNNWIGVGDHYIDVNGNAVDVGGFVDLGLQYGASPSNRAIW